MAWIFDLFKKENCRCDACRERWTALIIGRYFENQCMRFIKRQRTPLPELPMAIVHRRLQQHLDAMFAAAVRN